MPVHDWTRVDAGIFHHFHVAWIDEIARALNRGLLPADYYALAEQIAGGWEPDVVTLKGPKKGEMPENQPRGAVALAAVPPKVHLCQDGNGLVCGQGQGGGCPPHQRASGHRDGGSGLARQQE